MITGFNAKAWLHQYARILPSRVNQLRGAGMWLWLVALGANCMAQTASPSPFRQTASPATVARVQAAIHIIRCTGEGALADAIEQDFAEGRIREFSLPPDQGRKILGSSHGSGYALNTEHGHDSARDAQTLRHEKAHHDRAKGHPTQFDPHVNPLAGQVSAAQGFLNHAEMHVEDAAWYCGIPFYCFNSAKDCAVIRQSWDFAKHLRIQGGAGDFTQIFDGISLPSSPPDWTDQDSEILEWECDCLFNPPL